MNLPDIPTVDELIADPSSSFWLKKTLQLALKRDPMDAANDAALLSLILARRANEIALNQFTRSLDAALPGIFLDLDNVINRQPE